MKSLIEFNQTHSNSLPKKTESKENTSLKPKCINYLKKLEKKGIPMLYNKRWAGNDFTKAGLPDLEIWISNHHLDIELKDKSVLSPLQTKTIELIRKTGNKVYVVTSFEQFKKIIDKTLDF